MIVRQTHRRGYVLVVTLGLLALASTLLVTIGRTAVHRALAARQEQEQLQRRWGASSCRSAVLPYAGEILSRQEQARRQPVPALRTTIVLGRQTFDLVISDEQAKANVNAMLERTDAKTVESRLRAAMVGSGVGNAVLLRPEAIVGPSAAAAPAESANPPAALRWISGPGQIFDDLPPAKLMGAAGSAPMDRLTCWGGGAINIFRASESALQVIGTPELSPLEIGRLIETRDAMFAGTSRPKLAAPTAGAPQPTTPPAALEPVARLLAQAGIDPKVRLTVAMSSTSSCYSVWVVARNERRSWYHLSVRDESNPLHPRTQTLTW